MIKCGSSANADVAQLVEQLIRNQQVIGSSPIVGSSFPSLSTFPPKSEPPDTPLLRLERRMYQMRHQLSTYILLRG